MNNFKTFLLQTSFETLSQFFRSPVRLYDVVFTMFCDYPGGNIACVNELPQSPEPEHVRAKLDRAAKVAQDVKLLAAATSVMNLDVQRPSPSKALYDSLRLLDLQQQQRAANDNAEEAPGIVAEEQIPEDLSFNQASRSPSNVISFEEALYDQTNKPT